MRCSSGARDDREADAHARPATERIAGDALVTTILARLER